MTDTWQYIIVGIVVAVAFLLSARSIYRAIRHKKSALNPCSTCPLKDNCNTSSTDCTKPQNTGNH